MAATLTHTIDVAVSPRQLAEAFTEFDGAEQAEFFSEVWKIAKAWPGAGWCQQSCDIIRNLDKDGVEAVNALAEHLALSKVEAA